MSDLTGVHAKLGRAATHIDDVTRRLEDYLLGEPFRVAWEDDPATGSRVLRVREITEQIPTEIPLIIGDAVHNMRSALDHFACQAVPASDWDNAAFPIPKEARPLLSKDMKKIGAASQRFRQGVRETEPHPGGAGALLWTLSKLDNIDKHRLLLTVGANHSAFTIDMSARINALWVEKRAGTGRPIPQVPPMPIALRPAARYPVEVGTVLVDADPGGAADVQSVTFDVAFGEPDTFAGTEVTRGLWSIHEKVNNMVTTLTPLLP